MKRASKSNPFQSILIIVLLLAVAVLLAACGGGSDSDDASDAAAPIEAVPESANRSAAPTMPVAQFAAVAADVDLTKVAESTGNGTPEPDGEPDLVLGQGAYDKLCAECHGDAGQGVADKGESIVGTSLDEVAFLDLVRTGGGYGNEHIFASIKISDDGIGFSKREEVDSTESRRTGVGLQVMYYRADLIGADLTIEENARGGTSVICTVRSCPE